MGTIYVDSGGNVANSGSTDDTSPITGTTATRISANVVQLDALTDLSAVVTSGANQSSININGASSAAPASSVFWITLVTGSGGATPQVTLHADPTGMTTNTWRIGGRYLGQGSNTTNAPVNAIRAGDVMIYNNTPASRTAAHVTVGASGDLTTGRVTFRGAASTRPTLAVTNNSNVLVRNSKNYIYWGSLTLSQTGGSSQEIINAITATIVGYDLKLTGGAAIGISAGGGGFAFAGEITGMTGNAFDTSSTHACCSGFNVHDNSAIGFNLDVATGNLQFCWNVVDTNVGKGIYKNFNETGPQTDHTVIDHNTIYLNGDSGFEASDASNPITLTNSILLDNGNTGTEFNFEWAAADGSIEYSGQHWYNCLSIAGGVGGGNYTTNFTLASTEITGDPLFTNAGNADFSLTASSPCRATAYPGLFLGGSTGYSSMGAIIPQTTSGGGSHIIGQLQMKEAA